MRIVPEDYKRIREGLKILEEIDTYLSLGVDFDKFKILYEQWTIIAKILQELLQEGIEDGQGGEINE